MGSGWLSRRRMFRDYGCCKVHPDSKAVNAKGECKPCQHLRTHKEPLEVTLKRKQDEYYRKYMQKVGSYIKDRGDKDDHVSKRSNSGFRLDSSFRNLPKYRIKKKSKSQAGTNRELSKIKEALINEKGGACESCGRHGNVDLSHLIPRSQRKDMECDTANLALKCRKCHAEYESRNFFAIRKFKNYEEIMSRIKILDEGYFWRMVNKFNDQVEKSR